MERGFRSLYQIETRLSIGRTRKQGKSDGIDEISGMKQTSLVFLSGSDLTHSLQMIAFYCYFPPVRARPIRQLEWKTSLNFIQGKWFLDLRKYKTYNKYGPLITVKGRIIPDC